MGSGWTCPSCGYRDCTLVVAGMRVTARCHRCGADDYLAGSGQHDSGGYRFTVIPADLSGGS